MIPEDKFTLCGIRIVYATSFSIFHKVIYSFNKSYYNNKFTVENSLADNFLEKKIYSN